MIKLDANNHVQDYTLILARRNHSHLGQLKNVTEVVSKINMSEANEISFTVYKYADDGINRIEPLWDEITDFKYVFVKELQEYYEIAVELNDEDTIYKTITGRSACECELSQSYIYGLEINTENDIAREEYTNPTIFYNPQYPDCSLLHRALSKLPNYSIDHVDSSLINIQRTFSADGEDVYSFLTDTVANEIGCLFTFDSVNRSISAYDLKTTCIDCGYRGEYSDVCPECGSTDLQYYGEDTTVYIDKENLAENVNFKTDTDSVKNCFKLEAGDDNMTAAVVNCNPNGSSYIYYFSEDQKHDMSPELVAKLEAYDALNDSYKEEYTQVMNTMYDAIDKIVYYTSGMMPTIEHAETDAATEAAKLTEENMSPIGLPTVQSSTSVATVNTAVRNYAKVFVKTGFFKVEINEGDFSFEGTDAEGESYGYWYGNLKVTNYSDEEDVAISPTIRIRVDNDYRNYLDQKIDKVLANADDEDGSIFDVLSIDDLEQFKTALTYYCLNRLISFNDAIQGVIDVMIEETQGSEDSDIYTEFYTPYRDKLDACQAEMDKRNETIEQYNTTLNTATQRQKEIQKALDFEAFLGEELYNEFLCYKREDKYSNENYISEGFENNEVFQKARDFLEVAKNELIKSGEHQHSISSTLFNLLAMKEFIPLRDKFEVGNFIRVRVDGKIYRLRLISYQITFDDIQNIDVEFSDVTKIKNGTSDLNSVLNKTTSMASSYDAVVNQVKNSKEQTDIFRNFVQHGLDTTLMKIVNNTDNQNITIGETGLLARRMDEFTERYDECQLKLLSNGLYTTSDNWRTINTAIGKAYFVDPKTQKVEVMYGIQASQIVGQIILGNSLGITSQDGSSEMSFDNFGLKLNAIDDGTGNYKRILDIQKDGVSQLYVDNHGNIILATDQMIQTSEAIDRLNALYADIENLYVSNATIEQLLAKYATIENLQAIEAQIKDLDVETIQGEIAKFNELFANYADIIKLVANEAEIEELKAGNVTIAGKLKANEAEIETLKATSITAGDLEAFKATIDQLFALYASIEYLEANYIKANEIEATYAKIGSLDATNAVIENLKVTIASIETLVADKASIEDLNAVTATIETLNAKLANIDTILADVITTDELNAEIAKINTLITNQINAVNASIANLDAKFATIGQLEAEIATVKTLIADKASIGDLEAANADIGELNALVANIETILSGSIGTGILQTVHLTAQNVVIDDAVIKSAMIDSLDVSKLNAGTISTDKFQVQSDDGGFKVIGNTTQWTDASGKVRMQAGRDNTGAFNFAVFGNDGTTAIFNENGVQKGGIASDVIVDDMVADNANIQGSKLDIDSVVTEINDNGTQTISSSKIWIDSENQSLGASFSEITEEISQKVSQEEVDEAVDNIQIGTVNLIKNAKTMVYFQYGIKDSMEYYYQLTDGNGDHLLDNNNNILVG